MSAVRFMAFADRSWSFDQGVQEISRFSCMLFLSVRGFFDYTGPINPHSRKRGCRVAFLPSERSQHPDPSVFRSSIAGPLIPLSTLQAAPRDATCKTRGQNGFATLLSCSRALSSLHNAGLARRTPRYRLFAN